MLYDSFLRASLRAAFNHAFSGGSMACPIAR
jgi:hypothetical protein